MRAMTHDTATYITGGAPPENQYKFLVQKLYMHVFRNHTHMIQIRVLIYSV